MRIASPNTNDEPHREREEPDTVERSRISARELRRRALRGAIVTALLSLPFVLLVWVVGNILISAEAGTLFESFGTLEQPAAAWEGPAHIGLTLLALLIEVGIGLASYWGRLDT